ncbi:histidine phosphatase family protein [Aurantimonas endophytica]|uniref:Putative phosphoglycerate mutase n=1 Tax=Aurantimonas endophytica TaxID=1522175 RepID=A0A7W6MPI0_9HYPH|nr:histidine phosphatase family protein [Aurantimonas endophytica]MBB4002973.1 putative phosphoglycerate mutase [Aurantimonas endophytica]MCO6403849.1 histidine phosphatase family protein [Aurantimonas endophytica]
MSLPLLYLCRHGLTAWNAEGRLQGQEDVPLTPRGRDQAARNGLYLRNVLGEKAASLRFISSPLSRTVETMRIIRGQLGLEPDDFDRDARLVELHFGDWQGSTLAEIAARDPGRIAARKADKWHFVPPGPQGESYEMLEQRVGPVFDELDVPTLITAHGGITRSFLRRHAGMDPDTAARFGVPQDRILRWQDGEVAWV